MNITILKTYALVHPYLKLVQEAGDENKRELGFLARSAYEQQADHGRLWVAVNSETSKYIGHLLFGGRYPNLKIFQMFVHQSHRNAGIAASLVNELEKYGEANSYISISARVADDLPANAFWEKIGLTTVKKVAGGCTTKRIINVRSKELNTPSLLKLMRGDVFRRHDAMSYNDKPTFSNPVYVLDVNIVLDVVRKRLHRREASAIMRASFNNKIRLCITKEFIIELERSSKDLSSDPLLELAKELPVLSGSTPVNGELLRDLRPAIFPLRSLSGTKATQDNSDLTHLAHAIVNGADGFITRETAILRASSYLSSTYGLDVLSPVDLFYEQESKIIRAAVESTKCMLHIHEPDPGDIPDIIAFLQNNSLNPTDLKRLVSFEVSGAEVQRICIKNGLKIIGFALWDAPSSVSQACNLWFYVDETDPAAERAIDHVLESVFRSGIPQLIRRITLHTGAGNEFVRATAIQRGFRAVDDRKDVLNKICRSGIITDKNWSKFSDNFYKTSGLKLQAKFPEITDIHQVVIEITDTKTNSQWKVSTFDFETLVSPGILLYPGREGILVPIRPSYAADLDIINPLQMSLLPKKEASLYIEKAYFRKNSGHRNYKSGMIVVFYVSKTSSDSKSAVGCGRVTFSGALTVDEIIGKLSRQGVLSREKLTSLSGKSGIIHAYTYDNFNALPKRVERSELLKLGAIGGANLVTAEKLSFEKLSQILQVAFE